MAAAGAGASAATLLLVVADHLLTGDDADSDVTSNKRPGVVVVDVRTGRISSVHFGPLTDALRKASGGSNARIVRVPLLTPGFVDIHNHGIGGDTNSVCEYFLSDATTRALPQFGVTSFLASLTFPADNQSLTDRVMASVERQAKHFDTPWDEKATTAVAAGAAAVDSKDGSIPAPEPGARSRVGGIHAEGPIIATLGGLPPSDKHMSLKAFESLLDAMPSLRVMTISPSLEAQLGTPAGPPVADGQPPRVAYERLRALLKRGVRPAIGHDLVCNESQILGALRVARDEFAAEPIKHQLHLTHCFNVSTFHHRNVSLANFGLMSHFPQGLGPAYANLVPPTIELIGDLVHVHPLTLAHALQAKPSRDACLVSDAIMSPTDHTPKEYSGRLIEVMGAGNVPPEPTCGCAAVGAAHAALTAAVGVAHATLLTAAAAIDAKAAAGAAAAAEAAAESPKPKLPLVAAGMEHAKRVVVKGSDTLYGGCGSSLDLFHNAVRICGMPVHRAVQCCTSTPARIANLKGVGRLAAEYHADMLVFGGSGDGLTLCATFIAGRVAWRSQTAASLTAAALPLSASATVDTHTAQHSNATRTDHTAAQIARNEQSLKQMQAQAAAAAAAAGAAAKGAVSDTDRALALKVSVRRGDIARVMDCHAIVNAANETLEGGGGVDGAIHNAAGTGLRAECMKLPVKALKRSTVVDRGRCDVAEAVVTGAHKLPGAKCVIHTVAPLLDGATGQPDAAALTDCYKACLAHVDGVKIRSLALCCIGTGFYAFPMLDACTIAMRTVRDWLQTGNNLTKCDRVVFMVWNSTEHDVYTLMLPQVFPAAAAPAAASAVK